MRVIQFEYKTKKCEHDPVTIFDTSIISKQVFAGRVGWSYFEHDLHKQKWFCTKCNAELKAEWKSTTKEL